MFASGFDSFDVATTSNAGETRDPVIPILSVPSPPSTNAAKTAVGSHVTCTHQFFLTLAPSALFLL